MDFVDYCKEHNLLNVPMGEAFEIYTKAEKDREDAIKAEKERLEKDDLARRTKIGEECIFFNL